MKTQGNERLTETYAISGEPERPVRDAAREYGPVADHQDADTVDVTFAAGRTISLGNYEFARVQIGARVGVDPAADQDAVVAGVQAFVAEILAREEALVRRVQRVPDPLPHLEGRKRMVWVEYGMTLNAAQRFESHKIEVGISRPIGDAEDAAAAVDALQQYLAARVGAERDRLRGKE